MEKETKKVVEKKPATTKKGCDMCEDDDVSLAGNHPDSCSCSSCSKDKKKCI